MRISRNREVDRAPGSNSRFEPARVARRLRRPCLTMGHLPPRRANSASGWRARTKVPASSPGLAPGLPVPSGCFVRAKGLALTSAPVAETAVVGPSAPSSSQGVLPPARKSSLRTGSATRVRGLTISRTWCLALPTNTASHPQHAGGTSNGAFVSRFEGRPRCSISPGRLGAICHFGWGPQSAFGQTRFPRIEMPTASNAVTSSHHERTGL
jgi:hypothetical protein